MLGGSFFHWQLARRGLILQDGPHQEIMRRLKVADFMEPSEPQAGQAAAPIDAEAPRLLATDTLERALRQFDQHGLTNIPVVSSQDESKVIGSARRVTALGCFNKALIESHEEEHK